MPLEKENRYRKFEVDLTQTRDLSTGQISASVSVVRAKCLKERLSENKVAFYCGRGPKPPREITSEVAELEMADDMSSATAKFEMQGQAHVVRFEQPADTTGVFDRRGTCAPPDAHLVAGMFENMDKAYGRVFGRRLATQRVDSNTRRPSVRSGDFSTHR